jgi:hypothetical protein
VLAGFACDGKKQNENTCISETSPKSRAADRPAGLPEKGRWLAPIPGRSANRRVRDLANKVAGEFERDRSGMAARLVDAECKPLVYNIGRDLIAMYPDRAEDLLEVFKSIKAPEVADSLCGEDNLRVRRDEVLAQRLDEVDEIPFVVTRMHRVAGVLFALPEEESGYFFSFLRP